MTTYRKLTETANGVYREHFVTQAVVDEFQRRPESRPFDTRNWVLAPELYDENAKGQKVPRNLPSAAQKSIETPNKKELAAQQLTQ